MGIIIVTVSVCLQFQEHIQRMSSKTIVLARTCCVLPWQSCMKCICIPIHSDLSDRQIIIVSLKHTTSQFLS